MRTAALGVRLARASAWLWLSLLACAASSCVLIDDFGKFKVEHRDAATNMPDASGDATPGADAHTAPETDAGADANRPADASAACKNVDCTALDGDCTRGECQNGKCVATPAHDDAACGGNKCTTCKAGSCGPPKDCSALDGACAHGTCNPSTGECTASAINEGKACFDTSPCTYAEQCQSGSCVGMALDCSAYDDECSQGVCDPAVGGCSFGPNRMSQACSDANPCTLDDRCTSAGICRSETNANTGTACDDYNQCSGTSANPDACDGAGACVPGEGVAAGTACDDDNECSSNDVCDGDGFCEGGPTREGEACNSGCSANTICQSGYCGPSTGLVPAYDKRCFLLWCGRASLCQEDWKHDRVCDCGCPFSDPDCNACSSRMCESDPGRKHRATSWCDQAGQAIANCPDSLKGDGKCDCGCQFVDPDCGGGACCGPTGKAGCGVSFVENCLCQHESNPEPDCCSKEWTQQCTDTAVALGCMVCP
jgi:hypothetical protein